MASRDQEAARIVVAGSTNTDMVVSVRALPAPGETVLGGEFMTAAGGKGANQAVAAARMGARVAFIACCGNDTFGRETLQGLRKDGIDTSGIRLAEDAVSGVALILVDQTGQNSIAVAPGANGKLSGEDVIRSRQKIREADYVLAQLEIPDEAVMTVIREAADAGAKMILNPAPARSLPVEWLSEIAVITPNETEAEQISGVPVVDRKTAAVAGRTIREMGVDCVVITLGSEGALIVKKDEELHVPGFHVSPVDATAAGDVFNGALAVCLAEGLDVAGAVRTSCAAAALSVTRRGAQPSAPERREVEAYLEVSRNED